MNSCFFVLATCPRELSPWQAFISLRLGESGALQLEPSAAFSELLLFSPPATTTRTRIHTPAGEGCSQIDASAAKGILYTPVNVPSLLPAREQLEYLCLTKEAHLHPVCCQCSVPSLPAGVLCCCS